MVNNELSKPMREALEYARWLFEQSPTHRINYGCNREGWFYAQFTTRGSIEFFCRPQTLAALARRELLECRETNYPDGYVGREYRYIPQNTEDD